MRELSLHILDLIQNSIEAGARTAFLEVKEDEEGYFIFRISDDGRGMSEELLSNVRDPFVTTRLTRVVGMGIPFIAMTTEQSGGRLTIESQEGKGTRIEATFLRNHLDRPPLGNLVATVKVILVGNSDLHLIMHYSAGKHTFAKQECRRLFHLRFGWMSRAGAPVQNQSISVLHLRIKAHRH